MARGQRNWSEATKAAVIAACESGTTMTEASNIYGVPLQTVSRWMQIDHRHLLPRVGAEKKSIADKLEDLVHTLIDAMPGKVDDASLAAAATSMGISVDKMRLLREQATSIQGETPATVEERDKRALELMERGKLRLLKTGTDG